MTKTKIYLSAFLLFCLFLFISACSNFYKATTAPSQTTDASSASITNLQMNNRYFILRNGEKSYRMKNLHVSDDKRFVSCTLDTVQDNHLVYIDNGRTKDRKYNKSVEGNEEAVLNEVHLFMNPDTTTSYGSYTLDLTKLSKIEIIEKDAKRTSSNHVITAIGVTAGVLLLAVIVIAATKSSCPFVSAYDGKEFSLQGEIYGGAIYPQLARHDYLPLRMQPMNDGSLQLKITNELKERQYTDIADLWVITHDKNMEVLADENGNLYSISKPVAPIKVLLNNKTDLTSTLASAGDGTMIIMDDTATINAGNEVYMKFNKPTNAAQGKLMLNLKNSYFLDLLYGEIAKGFGKYYNTYVVQQRSKPVNELMKWTKEQQIPLVVSVKTATGWKQVADITTIGPLATRSIIVPIELPANTEPFTEIRLSSGFMFWEIDQAAMEYSTEQNFTVEKLKVVSAIDEAGINVTDRLQKEDGIYLSQPKIGSSATLVYNPSNLTDDNKTRSYILHAKGYYEHVRSYNTKPDVAFLKQFKKSNAFPLYGLSVYKKMYAQQLQNMAKRN
ncbi:MAG: hypothetical protein ABIT96_08220 [Ferruginibacter sp.]